MGDIADPVRDSMVPLRSWPDLVERADLLVQPQSPGINKASSLEAKMMVVMRLTASVLNDYFSKSFFV